MIRTSQTYSGSATIITVLAIAAVTAVILGVAQLVPKDFRQSQALEVSLAAESAAWAGVEHALYAIKDRQQRNEFFELSGDSNPPFSRYQPPSDEEANCEINRTVCPGLDRQLGAPQNQTPADRKVFGSDDTYYRLVVWHRRQNVGNTHPIGGLDDGLDSVLNAFRNAPNVNPVLDRDAVRRLDMEGVSNDIRLQWKPVASSGCAVDDPGTRAYLVYTWIDRDGGPLLETTGGRDIARYPEERDIVIPKVAPEASVLSLRFLITNSDEAKVVNCFARYSIETRDSDTADLGFDVIESTGVSGGVQRKIRVAVNRENGRLLNIFDFGIACEDCINIEDY